ncbi:MAG: DUF4392 domain-containing protein, partial [Desulfurococcaceae archaeon]
MSVDLAFRGVIGKLYEAARLHAGKPLSEAASEAIVSRDPEHVMIVTGFKVLPTMVQETDGPPGALVLAKTLRCLGVDVSLGIEEESVSILEAGLEVLNIKCPIIPLPSNVDLSALSRRAFEEKGIDLLIFVEKAGSNNNGVYHNMLGVDVTRYHARAEALLNEGRLRGCCVISIGDGGNEVGFGLIKDAVERHVSKGKDCGCPCRGGIAACSKADLVVTSSTSNIGCYAVSCALSALKGGSWFYRGDLEVKLIRALIEAGAIDAMTGREEMMVDGVPVEVTASIVELMNYMSVKAKSAPNNQGYRG